MSRATEFLREIFRMGLLVPLGVCGAFWAVFVFYVVVSFSRGGVHAVRNWLFHISHGASGLAGLSVPRWDLTTSRLLAIAAATVLLWVANLRVLRTFLRDLKGKSGTS